MTTEFKQRIVKAIIENREHYPTASKQAVALDVNTSQLSRICNDDTDKVISDAKWLSIARKLDVALSDRPAWKAAKTKTFSYIYNQLLSCKENSVSNLLCDLPDIGKTFTAKCFVKDQKNAVLIDCSQVKSKQKFVREIAKEFGVIHTGRYADVYADLVYYLKSIPSTNPPIVIIDEAGDLEYPAFLEIKALWNATEGLCAWYMMGADGLKKKIEDNKDRKKVGYAEIFSRFGSTVQKVSPDGKEDIESFHKLQMAMVAKVNIEAESLKISTVFNQTGGSLRKLRDFAKSSN